MEKVLRHKKIVCCSLITFCIILTVLISCTISGFASTNASTAYPKKYYTSILIKPGDSLWKIASKYMDTEHNTIEEYILEIKTLNHLYNDNIMAGEYLTIPYYSTDSL